MKKKSSTPLVLIIVSFLFLGVFTNSCTRKAESNEDLIIPATDILTNSMSENPMSNNWVKRKDLLVYLDIESGLLITGIYQNEKQARIAFSLADNSVFGSTNPAG